MRALLERCPQKDSAEWNTPSGSFSVRGDAPYPIRNHRHQEKSHNAVKDTVLFLTWLHPVFSVYGIVSALKCVCAEVSE